MKVGGEIPLSFVGHHPTREVGVSVGFHYCQVVVLDGKGDDGAGRAIPAAEKKYLIRMIWVFTKMNEA